MIKIISLAKKYWYVIAGLVVLAVVVLKKKSKTEPKNSDEDAQTVLEKLRIRDSVSKDWYKSVALQLAENLGTAYGWYDPRRWYEDDEKVYDLIKELNKADFEAVKTLYFEVYAKGRNLSEDLAKNLDSRLYSLLKIK